jgi:H3 lysine-79-specific histone-lysine N-methyltransferase
VRPKDKDDFRPLKEIVQVIELVSKNYLPREYTATFNDETTGILRKLQRSQNWREADEFRKAVHRYNKVITNLRKDGSITKALDNIHGLELEHVEAILNQVYARTVSLEVDLLKKYENGTDNVYGELLPRFISRILKETKLKSNQIFIDLGSGVGNVVLQAALEFGCESWGCEMMENACKLAALQQKEFKARCRLWGLAAGEVHLEEGDFLTSTPIISVLKKADVVLVNNQAFTPELNDSLKLLFLDLKEGCQVVSLKPFVPEGHKITDRNRGEITNVFKVDKKEYFSGNVSWTDNMGYYYIQTKDSLLVEAFGQKT